MNMDSRAGTRKTPAGKPSYKRAHRASSKPTLVTAQENTTLEEQQPELVAPAVAVEEPPTVVEEPTRSRTPKFFSSIARVGKAADQPDADPQAARLARAMRGKAAGASQDEAQKKPVEAAPKARANAAPARPRSAFKMRYILGMISYLLIADFAGVYITNFMQANHLDANVFTAGPVSANRSTLVFLALLIVILIVFARFDLLPRSLGGLANSPASAPARARTSSAFEAKDAQPTVKQGVKGADDDLYREYRENQRYFQKRDRKR